MSKRRRALHQPRAFIVSRCLESLMKHEAGVLTWLLNRKFRGESIGLSNHFFYAKVFRATTDEPAIVIVYRWFALPSCWWTKQKKIRSHSLHKNGTQLPEETNLVSVHQHGLHDVTRRANSACNNNNNNKLYLLDYNKYSIAKAIHN